MEVTKKIPSLRFPGFEGEWGTTLLGEIGEFKTSSVDKLIRDGETVVNLVNYMDVYKHLEISNETKDSLMKVSAKDSQIQNNNLLKGDILFTPSSETPEDIGHSIVIFEDLENTLYSYHLVRFRPFQKLNIKYSHYFCNTDSVRSQIVKFATGSTRFTVGINEFSKISANIPPLPEQEKIADCLTAMDEKIEGQQRKVEHLQAYKKGLLQQLFSQTLRFPEFEGAWEEKKLGEIVLVKKKGGTPNYEVSKNVLLNNDFMENSSEPIYVGNDVDVAKTDLLILWDGSQAGKVYTGFEGVLGSTFTAINFKANISNLFIYNSLKNKLSVIQRVWREGSGIPHVAKDFIENYKIQLPSFPEQQKIADCLSLLDEKIELETQKLEKLQTYKKGLLQQLFV